MITATAQGILIAAINTIANICVASFINAIGKNKGLHPHRRANILATTICSFPFFLPYSGCVLLLLGGLNSMSDTYTFLPELRAGDMSINEKTPEDTMRNMGLIASPGMIGTEKTIVEIFENKLR